MRLLSYVTIIFSCPTARRMKWERLMATRFSWQEQCWTYTKNRIPCYCFTSQNFARYTLIHCIYSALFRVVVIVFHISNLIMVLLNMSHLHCFCYHRSRYMCITSSVLALNIQSISFSYLSFDVNHPKICRTHTYFFSSLSKQQCSKLKWTQFNTIQINEFNKLNNWFSGHPKMKLVSTIILNQ